MRKRAHNGRNGRFDRTVQRYTEQLLYQADTPEQSDTPDDNNDYTIDNPIMLQCPKYEALYRKTQLYKTI